VRPKNPLPALRIGQAVWLRTNEGVCGAHIARMSVSIVDLKLGDGRVISLHERQVHRAWDDAASAPFASRVKENEDD